LSPTAPEFPEWTPELPTEDEFAQVAAQARFGVQQKAANDVSRRRRQRIFVAGGISLAAAVVIVMLIERFYDPAASAREAAIAAEVTRMTEKQKVTDSVTLIEIDIENAIMNNDLERARNELAQLVEKAPEHPRREFLEKSIDRAAELAKLSPPSAEKTTQAAVMPPPAERPVASKPRGVERVAERIPERANRAAGQNIAQRSTQAAEPPPARVYGAPIGEAPRQSLPLDAPINAPPVTTVRRPDNSFPGRTVEAGDQGGRTPTPQQPLPQQTSVQQSVARAPINLTQPASGSAAVPMPSAAPPAPQAVPAPVDVVPAKIVKRVMPVPPSNLGRNNKGFVVVTFNIGANGRVSDIQVVESEPRGVFDDAAQDAVRKWVYEPRKENGVAVESNAKARLVFDPGN